MEVANVCNRTFMRLLLNCFNSRCDVVPLAPIELYRQLVARRERGHTSNLRQIDARKGLAPDITSWCADKETVLGFPRVKLEETSQLLCINLILDCYCILFVYQCFRTKTISPSDLPPFWSVFSSLLFLRQNLVLTKRALGWACWFYGKCQELHLGRTQELSISFQVWKR